MARYPGAIWKPLDSAYVPSLKIVEYNRMNLHIAVSNADSLYSFFNQPGRASSHFYVRFDGTVEQYIDTAYRAEADLEGNDATISVETAGGLESRKPWTDEQREALAKLYAWAVQTHNIPVRLATTSKPGITSKGLSWHRLGIDGNFPDLPSPLAGRIQRGGGMHYSTAAGKQCPLDVNIRLIPSIFDRAKEILNPVAPPVTKIPEEDMAFVTQYGSSAYFLVSGDRIVQITKTSALRFKEDGGLLTALNAEDVDKLRAQFVSEASTVGDVTVNIDYGKLAAAIKTALKSTELQFVDAD